MFNLSSKSSSWLNISKNGDTIGHPVTSFQPTDLEHVNYDQPFATINHPNLRALILTVWLVCRPQSEMVLWVRPSAGNANKMSYELSKNVGGFQINPLNVCKSLQRTHTLERDLIIHVFKNSRTLSHKDI